MQNLQRFNVLIGILLAVAIIAVANFVFHVPEGLGRGGVVLGAVLVFVGCAFFWRPRP